MMLLVLLLWSGVAVARSASTVWVFLVGRLNERHLWFRHVQHPAGARRQRGHSGCRRKWRLSVSVVGVSAAWGPRRRWEFPRSLGDRLGWHTGHGDDDSTHGLRLQWHGGLGARDGPANIGANGRLLFTHNRGPVDGGRLWSRHEHNGTLARRQGCTQRAGVTVSCGALRPTSARSDHLLDHPGYKCHN